MKKILTFIMTAIVAAGTFASGNQQGGQDNPDVAVISGGHNIYHVIYASGGKEVVSVKIKDPKGKIIQRDYIRNIQCTRGFMRPYNMKGLEPGSYTMEVFSKGKLLVSRPLTVHRSGTMSVKSLTASKYEIQVKRDLPTDLTVFIYDNADKLLHKENFRAARSFTRVYDLSGFNKRGYTFELVSDTGTQRFSVK